jgi:NDP-sugar pyrophosphorylase family protein
MTTPIEKRAIIMAGGKGRRLAPYTVAIPKPVVPIGSTPVIEIVLRQLAQYGFRRVDIALGHLSEIVRAVTGNGTRFGVDISYSDEPEPLGTMGPLKRIADLRTDFLVMNADVLTDLDFDALWRFHLAHQQLATIATCTKVTRLELGVIECDAAGRVTGFEEKPVIRHTVSMGVYVFNDAVLRHIPDGRSFGFDDLMRVLLERGEVVRTFPFAGRWLDIGIPADYERAQEEFEQNRDTYLRTPIGPSLNRTGGRALDHGPID